MSARKRESESKPAISLEENDGFVRSHFTSNHGLTDRETEVLKWVSEAKSDAEIAIILGISRRTVNHHVSRILRKVGVENRVAASRMVLEVSFAGRAAQ